jgi:hypothetical protein
VILHLLVLKKPILTHLMNVPNMRHTTLTAYSFIQHIHYDMFRPVIAAIIHHVMRLEDFKHKVFSDADFPTFQTRAPTFRRFELGRRLSDVSNSDADFPTFQTRTPTLRRFNSDADFPTFQTRTLTFRRFKLGRRLYDVSNSDAGSPTFQTRTPTFRRFNLGR